MCFKKLICVVGFCAVFCWSTQAQTWDKMEEMLIEQLIEYLPEEQLEELDWSSFLEELDYFRARPIDLNQATWEDLASLTLLSPVLIQRLLHYRNQTGAFLDLRELQVIDGLDLEFAQFLGQFVTVNSDEASFKKVLNPGVEGVQELLVRYTRPLEKQDGYQIQDTTKSRYLGDPARVLMRYKYQPDQYFKLVLNMEKDPGEQFFAGRQSKGFDFYSGSLELKKISRFSKIVLGDYVMQFGQGLGLWSGFSMGKGGILHGIARQGVGLKAHTSSDEIGFFRGAAGTMNFGSWEVTPFVSFRQRAGRLILGDQGERFFASFAKSGLYRTPNEAANKNQIQHRVFGWNLQYNHQIGKFGMNWNTSLLDASLIPDPLLRNQFMFSGDRLSHLSMYYQLNYRNFYFFGDQAKLLGGGSALLHGALISLHHYVSLALLYRHYQTTHYSFFANSFGENSVPANENGFYTGFQFQPNRKFSFVFYYDDFRFPWLKYRVDAPSIGKDLLSQLTYRWTKGSSLLFRFRYREKQENDNLNLLENELIDVVHSQFRIHLDMLIGNSWRWRSRMELTSHQFVGYERKYGWLLYQDVFYGKSGSKLSSNMRVAVFNTSDYNTRIYAFENDVLYASSFPVYYDRGYKTYLNVRWRMHSRIDFWLRYAIAYYPNKSELGSGLDLIRGNTRSEVKTQVRIKLSKV